MVYHLVFIETFPASTHCPCSVYLGKLSQYPTTIDSSLEVFAPGRRKTPSQIQAAVAGLAHSGGIFFSRSHSSRARVNDSVSICPFAWALTSSISWSGKSAVTFIRYTIRSPIVSDKSSRMNGHGPLYRSFFQSLPCSPGESDWHRISTRITSQPNFGERLLWLIDRVHHPGASLDARMAHSISPLWTNRFRPRASVLSTPKPVVVVPVRRVVPVAVSRS